MDKVYVIGHKNPDTDSVVSAIVFKEYLRKKKIDAVSVVAGKLNRESKFVLSFLKEKQPSILSFAGNKLFFLVDHGNLDEAIKNLKPSLIFGILDHHKMSGISTDFPIFYRCEPVGSTSTLVYKMFHESKIKLTKKQASLLLCGIISDTLKFKSSTTTKEDEIASKKLSKISKIKINELAKELFKAKSDVSGMNPKDIILTDYKEFSFSKTKIGVGVHETVDPSAVYGIKEKIFQELAKTKKTRKVDLMIFAVIDILNKNCFFYLPFSAEKEIISKIYKGKYLEEKIMMVPGIVSRKKEIIPPLSNFFS